MNYDTCLTVRVLAELTNRRQSLMRVAGGWMIRNDIPPTFRDLEAVASFLNIETAMNVPQCGTCKAPLDNDPAKLFDHVCKPSETYPPVREWPCAAPGCRAVTSNYWTDGWELICDNLRSRLIASCLVTPTVDSVSIICPSCWSIIRSHPVTVARLAEIAEVEAQRERLRRIDDDPDCPL